MPSSTIHGRRRSSPSTGDRDLRVDSEVEVTLGVMDDSGFQRILTPRRSARPRNVAPRKSGRVWMRYAVPSNAIQELAYPPTHLAVRGASDLDRIGWISLWHYAGANGMNALAGLNG